LLNIGWFSTGRDEAARQLLQAVWQSIASGEIKARVSFVFSNREPGEAGESDLFFELVRSYDLPLICLSHRKFRSRLLERDSSVAPLPQNDRKQRARNDSAPSAADWRLQYDREVIARTEKLSPDLGILAGYMLIVGEEMCRRYNMINLHPAPPGGPKGTWQEVMRQLIENKAERGGAMMHLVTPELDRGPAVSYCLFSLRGKPFDRYWQEDDREALFKLIRRHELAREFPLIISTLRAFGERQIIIKDGRVTDGGGNPIAGSDLTAEVDRAVKAGQL